MKIIFMGTPKFSVQILESLIKLHDVVLVVTQPDAVVGRKKQIVFSPVKECALKHNIEVFQPMKIKLEMDKILNTQADIIITAAYGQIIPKKILNYPKYKAVNVHASLLPKLRGGAPIHKSIIEGHEETGVTIMYMVKKMDAGDILSQRSIPILDTDNTTGLFEKLSVVGRDLLIDTLPSIFERNIMPLPQNEAEVTYAYNITHDEQFINWNKPATDIFNLVRGLSLEPGALTTYSGELFKIGSVRIIEDNSECEPGKIISLSKKILVKTATDAIEILTIQASGKKMMDAKSYLNGSKVLDLDISFSNDIV